MIDPIDYVDPQIKYDHVPLQFNKKTVVHAKKKKPKCNEDSIVVIDDEHNNNVNHSVDSQENVTQIQLQSTPSKSYLKEYVLNNDNKIETGTISSVTSWTSSSNEILCSNNSWVINTLIV